MSGWVKVYRQYLYSDEWLREPFTRGQAWIDMIALANHKPGFIRVRGVRIEVKRGQLGWSELSLSVRWKWSRGRVRRYLDELEKVGQQIVQQKTKLTTLITIVNYEKYQVSSTTDETTNSTTGSTTDGQQTVQQTDTNKNVKKVKNEKNLFVPPTQIEIEDYLKSQKGINGQLGKQLAENFIEFYGSKGWMVGKHQMKDWKLAVSGSLKWESNEKLINSFNRPMVR